jgi:hypothetical protein
MSAISYEVLDKLTGELLPERTALGTVSTAFNNAGMGGGMWGHNEGTTVVSACSAGNHDGTPGLVGLLGLGYNPDRTFTCIPAAVASS